MEMEEKMANILVVEDSPEVQLIIKKGLDGLDAEITPATSGLEARSLLAMQSSDLILLDIQLPDQDGLQLCTEIRTNKETSHIPIFFITGKKDIAYKLTAFSMGAQDFIEKPFHPLELRARVEAKLKYLKSTSDDSQVIKCGPLFLNASTQRTSVSINNEQVSIHLTPIEFKLLFYLARNEENILNREQIVNSVWNNSADVNDRTVDAHISGIRKKLGDLSHYIESVSGQGYRFSSRERQRQKVK